MAASSSLPAVAAASLNGKHTIFGKLAVGKPALSKLCKAGTKRGKPKRKAYIKKATITVEPAEISVDKRRLK